MNVSRLFVVKDVKANIHTNPHFLRSTAEALRSWEVVANDDNSMISKFPNDFNLYELGILDEETATFHPHKSPVDLGAAASVKRKNTLKSAK